MKNSKSTTLLFLRSLTQTLAFLFIILLSISCTKVEEIPSVISSVKNENFVDISLAKQIAANLKFIESTKTTNSVKNSSNAFFLKSIEELNEVKNENGETSFYVVNYKEGGYILLSSDNRIQPVLAYSESGKFTVDEKKYPLGLGFWVDDTKNQIKEVRKSNIIQSDLCKKAWKEILKGLPLSNQSISDKKTLAEPPTKCYDHTDVLTVGPLISSTWHQEGGYNGALQFKTCYGYSSRVLAGCVPIAMGQVMRYFQYPSNYNWSSMPLNSATSTTANFISDIHTAIGSMYAGNPIYNCGSTGVSGSANMGSVLKSRFSYSSADWANYDWSTVKNNLNSSRPVILSGDNGSVGHMWVCDGYMETSFYYSDCSGSTLIPMFHMNWGWEDTSYNGYYGYNNFNVAGTNFSNNKKMIYNIIP